MAIGILAGLHLHRRGETPSVVVGQQLRVKADEVTLELTVTDVMPAPADPTSLIGHVRVRLVGGGDVYSMRRLPIVFVDSGGVQVPLNVNVGDLPYDLTINGAPASIEAPNLRAGDTADASLSYDGVDTRRLHGGRIVFRSAVGKDIAIWTIP